MEALRAEVRAWIAANHPGDPGFKLPQSALEVADDRQFAWLRGWQRGLYDAGYVGAEWPREYGGGGRERGSQRVIDQELGRARAPFLLNLVALSWAGPVILRYGSEAQKAKFIAPEADVRAAIATREEAKVRYERVHELNKRAPGTVPADEVRAAKLTHDRFVEEVRSKEAALRVAEKEIELATVVLNMYQVRAPVSGKIKAVLKNTGEGVRQMEAVLHLLPDQK